MASINICYSSIRHIRFLLHLHQTSIKVLVVTTAPDQQASILQFHASSSDVFNSYTQPAVKIVTPFSQHANLLLRVICVDTLHGLLFLSHCTLLLASHCTDCCFLSARNKIRENTSCLLFSLLFFLLVWFFVVVFWYFIHPSS